MQSPAVRIAVSALLLAAGCGDTSAPKLASQGSAGAGAAGGEAGAAGGGSGQAGSAGEPAGPGGGATSGGHAGVAGQSGPSICGNGVAELGEPCDGDDLRGESCADEAGPGSTGTLTCSGGCFFDITQCANAVWCGPGAQRGAPWPMARRCADGQSRSPFVPSGKPPTWVVSATYSPTSVPTPAVIDADGVAYLSTGGALVAIDSEGNTRWSTSLAPDGMLSSGAIGVDGTIYVASGDQHLFAVSPDGSIEWGTLLNGGGPAGISPSPPLVGRDGTLYLVAGNAGFAVRPDGSERETHAGATDTAIARDGTVYWTGDTLQAFSWSGVPTWTLGLEGGSNGVVVDDDGTIYLTQFPNAVSAVLSSVARDGSLLWATSVKPAAQLVGIGWHGEALLDDAYCSLSAFDTASGMFLDTLDGKSDFVTCKSGGLGGVAVRGDGKIFYLTNIFMPRLFGNANTTQGGGAAYSSIGSSGTVFSYVDVPAEVSSSVDILPAPVFWPPSW